MNRKIKLLVIAVTGIEILISFFLQSLNYLTGLLLIGLIVLFAILLFTGFVKKKYLLVGIFVAGMAVVTLTLGFTWWTQVNSGYIRVNAIIVSLILFACAIIVLFLSLGIYLRIKRRNTHPGTANRQISTNTSNDVKEV